MRVLSKHQKKGEEGFKNYVKTLETTPLDKAKEIISVGVLEDPVYLKWAMANMMSIDYIMSIREDYVVKVCNALVNPIKTLVFAFYKSPIEEKFIADKLNDTLKRQYQDEREYTPKVTKSQQLTSQQTIISTIRKLQHERDIPNFKWNLPDEKILTGQNYVVNNGKYESYYEDGTPALRGQLESKLRSGSWQHFYPSGTLMAEGNYVEDEKEGIWVFFFANGKKKAQGEFQENLKQGEWLEYDANGEEKLVIYERGRVIS